MKKTISIIKDNSIFFACYGLFIIYLCCLLVFFSKANGFLLLNSFHNNLLDQFFKFYTYVGDGFFSVAVFILLLIAGRRLLAVQVILAYAISGIISPICKNLFATPRPKAYLLQHNIDYLYINNIELAGNTSFPSGHSISVFALASILALNAKNKWLGFFYFLAAALVAYSRIYLGAHFPEDVLGGSVIGVITSLLVYYYFTFSYKGKLK